MKKTIREQLNYVSNKNQFYVLMAFLLFFLKTIPVFGDSRGIEEDIKDRQSKPEYIDPVSGMEFVHVSGGCFEMGDIFGDGDIDELPVHEVCVDDFYIGKYEVTNAQFRKFILATGYKTTAEKEGKGYAISHEGGDDRGLKKGVNWKHPLWPSDSLASKKDHPVVQVSWYDAQKFVKWLYRKRGRRFRLPTEAEWEYTARSGGKRYKYSWGDMKPFGNIADKTVRKFRKYKNWQVWKGYKDGYVYTSPVGRFKANGLGIYDIAGNVAEWCGDLYNSDYYKKNTKDNPKGPSSSNECVLRGGSWNFKPHFLRCANRIAIFPDSCSYYIGFRVVMMP